MNIKELKEILESVPDDYDVFLADWNEEYAQDTDLKSHEIEIDNDRKEVTFGLAAIFKP